jgi:hypothetical protein
MLTGDLLQFTRRSGRIHPRQVNPADKGLQAAAEGLIGLFRAHLGLRRGDLEEALARFVPPGLEPKRVRGLARLLWERCESQVSAAADPPALRQALFDAGAAGWASATDAGSLPWRAALVERVGQAQGLAVAEVDDGLYADLEENQILTAIDPPTPERLLYRYNVAQVQGILLRADRVQIRAFWPNPQRMRQLLRYLKFFGLLFTVERVTTPGKTWLELTVDGPLSVLEGATRYGLNLAQFFPALLLWEGRWRLTAAVRMRGRDSADSLEVEPNAALRSHYPDHGQWVPEDVRGFVSAFNAKPGDWGAAPAEDVLLLPGNAFLVPDYRFTHASAGRTVTLEHVVHPTAERIAALLARREAAAPERYALATRHIPGLPASRWLFTYRRTLTPAALRAWLETLPPDEGGGAVAGR